MVKSVNRLVQPHECIQQCVQGAAVCFIMQRGYDGLFEVEEGVFWSLLVPLEVNLKFVVFRHYVTSTKVREIR